MDGLHCAFVGRIGQVPELRYIPGGKAVLQFSVAVDEKPKANGDRSETIWVKCSAWEKRAEELQDIIDKGSEVYVEGRLKTSTWQTSSGETRFGLNCSCWKVEPLGAIGKKAQKRQEAERNREPEAADMIPF